MNRSPSRRRQPLSPPRIHRAALAIARAGGIEALSMRRLASALGVDAMSIYHHVPGKEALLQGMYQTLLAELPLPEADGAWQESLRELGRRFYRLARKYPKLFPHLISSPCATPREVEIYHRIRTILAAAGLAEAEAARTTRAIYTYATGIALVAASANRPRLGYQYGEAAGGQRGRGRDPERDLAASIELIIAGIEQRLAGSRGRKADAAGRRRSSCRGADRARRSTVCE